MAERTLKSILYDRTVDYTSRVVKNTDEMNFMELNTSCWNTQRREEF